MRILIVHNILWAHYKSSVFQALQQLVDQRGTDSVNVLQIARTERTRPIPSDLAAASVPVYTYQYELLYDRFLEDVSLSERTQALISRASAFKPDVITITGYYDPAQILLLCWAKLKGIKVVLQNESTAVDHVRGGWKERAKRWIIQQCDGFFCFGTESANYLIQLGVSPNKILMRKNAVDNNTLKTVYDRALFKRAGEQKHRNLRPNNFIFVGRFIGYKNLPLLLTAFSQAQQQSSEASQWGLILLGDGPEQAALSQQVDQLGLSDAVHFHSSLPWYQVPELLALSDVLILPSLSEPWGLVVNEAMACGLPVIVSNRCGCATDLVEDGKNGFIFDPVQPDQLVSLLLRFINGQLDRKSMQTESTQRIQAYSPEAVAQEMLSGFTSLVG